MQHKTKNRSWVADTEELSTQVAIEEAVARVQKIWEEALSEMKEEDRSFLADYFEGTSVRELAEKHNLSYKNAKSLILKLKRECIRNLTKKTVVRN